MKPPICCRKVDAVLSHAHEDHFNGFKLLYDNACKNVFENGYIPWFAMSDLDALGGILIKYSLLLYRYYSDSSIIAAHAKHWLLAAPVMASVCKKLWCVCAGDQVRSWDVPNKILWPPRPSQGQPQPSQGHEDELQKKWSAYLDKNGLPDNFLSDEAEEIQAILKRFYGTSPGNPQRDELSSEKVDQAITTINTVLTRNESRAEFSALKWSSPRHLYYKKYKPSIDNHSLIFEIGEPGNDGLFLSDAHDQTIKKMLTLNTLNDKQYKFIKSGHHGNRGAKELLAHNVSGDVVVNCCGPASSNWKGPDDNYLRVSKEVVVCLDWNNNSKKWQNKKGYFHPQECYFRIP
ncbi:MAG: hypothetical protein V5783_08375 [Pontiella sp.]